jgi:hypothetical protein
MFAVLSSASIMTKFCDNSIPSLKCVTREFCDDTKHWGVLGCCDQQTQLVNANCVLDRGVTALACNKCSLHLMHIWHRCLQREKWWLGVICQQTLHVICLRHKVRHRRPGIMSPCMYCKAVKFSASSMMSKVVDDAKQRDTAATS